MRAFIPLLLALSLAGCKKPGDNAPNSGGGAPNNTTLGGTLGRGPAGGSSTILGKARDRAVDLQIINEMRQVLLGLETDFPNGRGPADKDGWVRFLKDYRNLQQLVNNGEVIAFGNVSFRNPPSGAANTVLMYEKRVVDFNDGIVLTCDGTAQRMNKTQFEALTKPQ